MISAFTGLVVPRARGRVSPGGRQVVDVTEQPTAREPEPQGTRLRAAGETIAVVLKVIAAAVALYVTIKGTGPAN
jgi:hypothetical protein